MGKLDGKIALVTGSSRASVKQRLSGWLKKGQSWLLAARTLEGLRKTAAEIAAAGSEAEVVQTDVRVEAQIDNLFKKTMERFGRLDILINNAGIFSGGPIENMNTETWDDVIATTSGRLSCARAPPSVL